MSESPQPNSSLTIALFVAEQLIKESPGLFLAFQEIIASKDVTEEQIREKRAAIAAQTFESIVTNSEIPSVNPA